MALKLQLIFQNLELHVLIEDYMHLKFYNFYKQDMPDQFNVLENLLLGNDEYTQEALDDLSV